jgi:hypothetical protein
MNISPDGSERRSSTSDMEVTAESAKDETLGSVLQSPTSENARHDAACEQHAESSSPSPSLYRGSRPIPAEYFDDPDSHQIIIDMLGMFCRDLGIVVCVQGLINRKTSSFISSHRPAIGSLSC